MKAFKVYYATGGKQDSMVVLSEDESKMAEAIANKDKDYKIESTFCKIISSQEIPLSNVMLSDLTIEEFKMVLSK